MNQVKLSNGTTLDVDMVIVGIGAAPATKFLDRTDNGIKKDKFGGIECDPFLQTSQKDIYAAGDIASFPHWKSG